MSVLKNQRHELFAQELAKGSTGDAAYVTAGFKRNRHNAATLARQQHISNRVAELLAQRDRMAQEATKMAVEAAGVSKAWVLARLKENAERALQAVSIKDENGETIGEYKYEGSVANRALELLGKECGMFIDRKEVKRVGEFDRLADDELERIAASDGGSGTAQETPRPPLPH